MAYAHTTLGQLKTQLATRLNDASKTFWTDVELGNAVIETLRIWNVVTGHQRTRLTFSTAAATAFYDLSSVAGSVRPRTVRDRQLISEIEYHLMEPQGLSAWAGSDMFTLAQVVGALQHRRNQLLGDSACVVSSRVDAVAAADTYVDFPDSVIGVRRAVFYDAVSGRYWPLKPSDERTALVRSYRAWADGVPRTFSVAAAAPLRAILLPPPSMNGEMQSLVVATGDPLDPTANANTGTLMGVPDDLTPFVKWGALADLLYSSLGSDPARAEAAEQLFDIGVQLASALPVVLHVELDGRPTTPATLARTDAILGGWQGAERGRPRTLSVASPDLLALTPVPDSAFHSVAVDHVANATVPASATDDAAQLQIGREHLDAVLALSQWIVTFKTGGEDFRACEPLLGQFFAEAQTYSYRRAAVASALPEMMRSTPDATADTPWLRPPVTSASSEGGSDDVRSERNARRRKVRVP